MILFDEVTKIYKFGHIETDDNVSALKEFIDKKYDIMSYYGSLYLNPGDTILFIRDYISDIKSDIPIYYTIDDEEYLILNETRLLKFLSPLKSIYLRNKTDKIQLITFKRWTVKAEILDKLIVLPIKEEGHFYFYGEIHNET